MAKRNQYNFMNLCRTNHRFFPSHHIKTEGIIVEANNFENYRLHKTLKEEENRKNVQ